MAAVPKRATACEQVLLGAEWTREVVDSAAQALDQDFTPITDMRASREYRQLVAKNLLRKFYLETTTQRPLTRVLEYAE